MTDNDENVSWRDLPGTEYTELPGRHVTVNQIVAYNLAYWRKAAGMTQEELGNLLRGWTHKPWSKAVVSAAERSWDGKKIRQFDADLIMGLALSLGVPIAAFYLPPEDDGVKCRYLIDPPYPWGGVNIHGCSNMHDLLTFVLSDPPEDDDDVSRRYRERYLSTIEMHMPGLMPENFAEDASTEAQIKARVVKLRKQYDVLRSVMGDIETAFEGLHERLDKIREKRPPREIETKETSADHRPEGLPDAPVRPRTKAEEGTG